MCGNALILCKEPKGKKTKKEIVFSDPSLKAPGFVTFACIFVKKALGAMLRAFVEGDRAGRRGGCRYLFRRKCKNFREYIDLLACI